MDLQYSEQIREAATALFWSFVSKGAPNECWLWTGPRYSRDAYPRFRFHQTETGAHRFSYEIHNSPIPVLLHVCHHCDVPLCVNPSHLFLGSHKDNMVDKGQKERLRQSLGYPPSSKSRGKLHVNAVRAIRSNPNISLNSYAEEFGVTQNTIYQVRKHITYRWVQP